MPTTSPTTSPSTSPSTAPTPIPTTSPTTGPTTSPTTSPTSLPTPYECAEEDYLVNPDVNSRTFSSSVSDGLDQSQLDGDNSWRPLSNSDIEWAELDFQEPKIITAVHTQGQGDANLPDWWVTLYIVEIQPLFQQGGAWVSVGTFIGNVDRDTR
eukprot:UN31887